MTVLFVSFQALENYGGHVEDGKAINGNAHWKFKGGADYIVTNINTEQNALALATAHNMTNGLGWKEFPITWSIEEDGYMTDYEIDQYNDNHDGKVKFPATRLDMNDFLPKEAA